LKNFALKILHNFNRRRYAKVMTDPIAFRSLVARSKTCPGLFAAAILGIVFSQSTPASPIEVFSTGMIQPETLSPAPDNFAGHGGDYFVPDFGGSVSANSKIWIVPKTGGAPTQFAATPDAFYRGGTFLPSNWGTMAGDFVATGLSSDGTTGRVDIFAGNGTRTIFKSFANDTLGAPLIAAASFGSFGGDLLAGGVTSNSLFAIAPSGTTTTIASSGLPAAPGALAFSPNSFGLRSHELFLDGLNDNRIVTVASNGTVTPFSTIPLKPGQVSTAQMAFSPGDFLPGFGPLLFVSIRASTTGGGTLGDVLALNAHGTVVADLRTDLGLTAFDPRGLFFTSDDSLLIANTSDSAHSVFLVTGSDFQRVPEDFSTLPWFGIVAAGVLLAARRVSVA
jgi:hypothetical protein